MNETPSHLLVFGATGAIGEAVCEAALGLGWRVTGVARTARESRVKLLLADPGDTAFEAASLRADTPYTAVCWAQGANCNDSIYDVAMEQHAAIYAANVGYILITLQALLGAGLLARAARLCVVSSIWQNLARQNKLSYCVSKAALQGLVLSAAADLARDGHLMNAVLPGALETPMTRRNLAPEQIERIAGATGFNRLTSLEDVAAAVLYLCGPQNTGMTGQFLTVDLGFSHVRMV